MAYQTYTTEALVCGSYERLGANKSVQLFTREAGMLYADARSVREERSRQRYALQDFSELRSSLIRGKGGWRVGSVEPIINYYQAAPTRAARGSVVALVRFVRRFVRGEESNTALFDEVVAALRAINAAPAEPAPLQLVATIRVLTELGYIPHERVPLQVKHGSYQAAVSALDSDLHTDLSDLVATATLQSQL